MANADFNPKQTGTPGGFDAGSYREKAKPKKAASITTTLKASAAARVESAAGSFASSAASFCWRGVSVTACSGFAFSL